MKIEHDPLFIKLAGDGPRPAEVAGPCDACSRATRCATEKLACTAFELFANHGGSERWRVAARFPSREIFRLLFGAVVR